MLGGCFSPLRERIWRCSQAEKEVVLRDVAAASNALWLRNLFPFSGRRGMNGGLIPLCSLPIIDLPFPCSPGTGKSGSCCSISEGLGGG